jgi:hypothetical protein
LRKQLPDGMQHCTIRFKECEHGHGWLTADNWVQHGCPTCELRAAEQRVEGARELLEMFKRAAINMRGEDFNLSSAEWALVHAWLSPAKGDV